MEKYLKGQSFDDVKAVKTATQRTPVDIKVEKFKSCFKQWEKCNGCNGEYFNEDWRNFLKNVINKIFRTKSAKTNSMKYNE